MFQQDEQALIKRRQAERAVQLAMESRWEEAAGTNKSILSLFPNDADAHNRLGKALMELGRYTEAKKAYKRALELDVTNQIARKNLERINALAKGNGEQPKSAKVDPALFKEAIGKSTITVLRPTTAKPLPRLNAGDRVELLPQGKTLAVATANKELLGAVEPKLGLRLIKLIEGGNQYAAAVTSLHEDECRILIKETYQDPSQIGRPSFPAVAGEGTRPYTKERLVRRTGSTDESERPEDPDADASEAAAWDEEGGGRPGDVSLNQAAAAEDVDDDELEE